jgi:CheY-like chemotaxis protein
MEENTEQKNLSDMLILLVEDNISNQKVASRYMEKWGAKVDLAENGLICLEKIGSKEYDLILMDLQMPEMDGYTAAIEIRKLNNPKMKSIPIIALTASAFLDTKAKVLEAGMTDYISKPFVPQELYQILKQYYKKK